MRELIDKHGAKDSTARHTAHAELDAMQTRPSQYNPGSEIPEKSWAYRIAKKIAFHEYGVYSKHFEPDAWRDTRDEPPQASSESDLVQISS